MKTPKIDIDNIRYTNIIIIEYIIIEYPTERPVSVREHLELNALACWQGDRFQVWGRRGVYPG